ncbi:immunity 49 family protein [Kitasatospora sp. NPDC001574]
MTVTVERHLVPRPDAEAFADRQSQAVSGRVDRLERSAESIDFAFSTAVLAFQSHIAGDPEGSRLETWQAAVVAMQLGDALFAVTGTDEGTVECFIEDKQRTVQAIGLRKFANAGNWFSAFWLAVICRDRQRMTRLAEIPLERLRAAEGAYDEFVFHWVDVQQTYWLRRPELVEKLTAAFATATPEASPNTPVDALQGIMYPPLNLFYHFVRGRKEEFGPALAEALNLHKAYWTLDEDRATDVDGALPLGPFAMACLAYDGKFPVGVESGYLPKYILERFWYGEFPT